MPTLGFSICTQVEPEDISSFHTSCLSTTANEAGNTGATLTLVYTSFMRLYTLCATTIQLNANSLVEYIVPDLRAHRGTT